MKAIFKITAAATAVAAALALQLPAVAQTAGTVDVGGQVTSATCILAMAEANSSNPVFGGARAMALGTVSTTGFDPNTRLVGTTKSTVSLTVRSAVTGASNFQCNLANNGLWNVLLDLNASQISGSGLSSTLVNTITPAQGGTNAVVALFGDASAVTPTRLELTAASNYRGTKVYGNNVGTQTTGTLYIGAQFASTSSSAPTPGQFSATVPLVVLYN